MELVISDRKLLISLFHGTPTLFLDSILES